MSKCRLPKVCINRENWRLLAWSPPQNRFQGKHLWEHVDKNISLHADWEKTECEKHHVMAQYAYIIQVT